MFDVAGLVMGGIAIYKACFKEYFDDSSLDYVSHAIILVTIGRILPIIISFLQGHAKL